MKCNEHAVRLLSKIAKLKLDITDESCPLFFAEGHACKFHKVVTFQEPLSPGGTEHKDMLDLGPSTRQGTSRMSLGAQTARFMGHCEEVTSDSLDAV